MSGIAIASEGETATDAYVRDSGNHVVRDHEGKCVRTASWSKETATRECNPELFPEPAAAAAAEPVYEKLSLSTNTLYGFDSAELMISGGDANEMATDVCGLVAGQAFPVDFGLADE